MCVGWEMKTGLERNGVERNAASTNISEVTMIENKQLEIAPTADDLGSEISLNGHNRYIGTF